MTNNDSKNIPTLLWFHSGCIFGVLEFSAKDNNQAISLYFR